MIGLFLNKYNDEKMKCSNGDIIIKDVISAIVEMRRNQIWYLNIEFPKDCLRGKKITNECVFKVDLDYIKGQLFRCIYYRENKTKKTYICYASHVFFDSQKECVAFDSRAVSKNWEGTINELNSIIKSNSNGYPYNVIGKGNTIDENTSYWVKKNLIECMFGTHDNSLINRWSKYIDENMIVAMFDNYDCYFGYDSYYPANMKSNTIVLATTKELIEYVIEISMEEVATGIIPQAYNGRMLPKNEIVKSDYWDKYMIHRLAFKEYPNLILSGDKEADASMGDKTFPSEAKLQNALREQARIDVDTITKHPKKSVRIKVSDLSQTDNSSINHCKLNDILILTVDENGERETFCFDSIKYDVVKKVTTEMSLVLKG